MSPARRLTVALVGLIVLVMVGWFAKDLGGSAAVAPTGVPGVESSLPVKPLSSLPEQAAATWKLIQSGGPFPYPRNDGVPFRNREKRLPVKQGDYYHEYTVPTPGSPDRGARRLVTGSGKEVYYTGDHYASFVVVDVTR